MKLQDLQAKNHTGFPHKAISKRSAAPKSVVASAESTTPVNPICPTDNGTTYTTIYEQPYELYCHTDFNGNDLPTVHADSYAQCIEQCDLYRALSNQTNGAVCIASVYWATNPYPGNCYLKYEIPLRSVVTNNTLVQGAKRVQYAFNGGPVYVPFDVVPTQTPGHPMMPASSPDATSTPQTSSTPPSSPMLALSSDTKVAIGASIAAIGLLLVAISVILFRRRRSGHRQEQQARITRNDRSLNSEPSSNSGEKRSYIDVLEAARRTSHDVDRSRDTGTICELPGQLSPQLDPLRMHEANSIAPSNEGFVIEGDTPRASSQALETITEVEEDQATSRSSPPPKLPPKTPPPTPPKMYSNLASAHEAILGPVSPISKSFARFRPIATERSPVSSPEPSPRAIVQDEKALSPERRHLLVSKAKRSRTTLFL